MSRFFKSAAFPILIVVVLAFFAQKLISPGARTHVPNYSEFVGQVQQGQVKDVTIQTKDNTLDVELKTGKKYQTAYPDNTEPVLVKTLEDNQVGIDVRGKGGGGWITVLT
ncbi:MAG: ATP-dependent metallopeptidase FtsH/Yme1/Tma family protein, partial [Thermoleophilaceae bacterium]